MGLDARAFAVKIEARVLLLYPTTHLVETKIILHHLVDKSAVACKFLTDHLQIYMKRSF